MHIAATCCALGLIVGPLAPNAAANERPERSPIIAMGDSIPYGYDPNLAAIGAFADMRGYPELLARSGKRPIANLSCPGQTAQAMLTSSAPDYLCPFFLAAGGPLHWNYSGTQIDAAVTFLTHHPDTGLVTITAGGNDFARCNTLPPDQTQHCIDASFPAVRHALTATIRRLRAASYRGPIVLTTYYPFTAPFDAVNPLLLRLRQVVFEVAASSGALVADTWTAFERAARRHGGDPCLARLLIKLADGSCDIHPSPNGDRILAEAVRQTLDARAD